MRRRRRRRRQDAWQVAQTSKSNTEEPMCVCNMRRRSAWARTMMLFEAKREGERERRDRERCIYKDIQKRAVWNGKMEGAAEKWRAERHQRV